MAVTINLNLVVDAGGTADALTATLSPAITANTDKTLIWVRSVNTNLTTTPTITLNGWAAKPIAKKGAVALLAGDIQGSGHVLELVYNSGGYFELLNPALTNVNEVSGILPLSSGGTAKNMTAVNGGVVWTDANSMEVTAAGASGQILQSNGAAAPSWSTPTYPSASGSAGKIIRANGTNNVYSTSTFADTYTASNLLYSNGANTVQGLATANSGILITSGAGVPSIGTAIPNGVTATTQAANDNSTKVATTAYVDAKPRTGVVREYWIGAGAMNPRITNGAAQSTSESSTNDITYDTLDFDQTTSEGACFQISLPQAWNAGTVKAKFYWTAASGAGTVTWSLKGGSLADDDAIDTAYGTAQAVTDTLITALDMHVTTATAAITIAGTPAVDDWLYFEVSRDIADTLNADAKLIGIKLQYTETSTEPSAW